MLSACCAQLMQSARLAGITLPSNLRFTVWCGHGSSGRAVSSYVHVGEAMLRSQAGQWPMHPVQTRLAVKCDTVVPFEPLVAERRGPPNYVQKLPFVVAHHSETDQGGEIPRIHPACSCSSTTDHCFHTWQVFALGTRPE